MKIIDRTTFDNDIISLRDSIINTLKPKYIIKFPFGLYDIPNICNTIKIALLKDGGFWCGAGLVVGQLEIYCNYNTMQFDKTIKLWCHNEYVENIKELLHSILDDSYTLDIQIWRGKLRSYRSTYHVGSLS